MSDLTIQEVFDYYDVEDTLSSRRPILCPLPNHDEKTASFHYYESTESFYCFGCGVGGNALTFAYHYHRQAIDPSITFEEVRKLFYGEETSENQIVLAAEKIKLPTKEEIDQEYDFEAFLSRVSTACRRYLRSLPSSNTFPALDSTSKVTALANSIWLNENSEAAKLLLSRLQEYFDQERKKSLFYTVPETEENEFYPEEMREIQVSWKFRYNPLQKEIAFFNGLQTTLLNRTAASFFENESILIPKLTVPSKSDNLKCSLL